MTKTIFEYVYVLLYNTNGHQYECVLIEESESCHIIQSTTIYVNQPTNQPNAMTNEEKRIIKKNYSQITHTI